MVYLCSKRTGYSISLPTFPKRKQGHLFITLTNSMTYKLHEHVGVKRKQAHLFSTLTNSMTYKLHEHVGV